MNVSQEFAILADSVRIHGINTERAAREGVKLCWLELHLPSISRQKSTITKKRGKISQSEFSKLAPQDPIIVGFKSFLPPNIVLSPTALLYLLTIQ